MPDLIESQAWKTAVDALRRAMRAATLRTVEALDEGIVLMSYDDDVEDTEARAWSDAPPVSIFGYPPPELRPLRDAIREAIATGRTLNDGLITGAATAYYCRLVIEHYEQHHPASKCDCAEDPDE